MRRLIIITVVALVAVSTVLLVWRPWEMTRERWIHSAMQRLREMPPPPTNLVTSVGEGDWAGKGYMLFSNGWACFSYHTFHESERVGDIALLRASDGSFYVCHFHFCVGLGEYWQSVRPPEERQLQPRDIGHFIELYEKKQGWKRLPDA